MARENFRKVKLLKLLEMLRQNTDEQHPISTSGLICSLAQMDIPCDRRTLSRDIATLSNLGYEIMTTTVGHEKAYYVEDRNFSIPELKILIDAVHASNFISEKKSEELINKIASLAGTHRAEVLKRNMVCFNTRKHSNERVFYNVDVLEEAIISKRKVIFLYYDLNEKREKVYRKGGHHYVVEPIALVFNEDNYYLLVYSAKYDNTGTYRIDRMEAVELLEEPLSQKALNLRSTIADHTEQAFKMFAGPLEDVVLEFDQSLLGVIYDRFGESTQMMKTSDSKYVASVKVQVSPVFWGWLFQFSTGMAILSPTKLVDEFKKQIASFEK